MKLPGPLRWLSLAASIVVASPAAVMAAISFADGEVLLGAVYLAAAGIVFVIPEYIVRKIPGPVTVLRAKLPLIGDGPSLRDRVRSRVPLLGRRESDEE